MKELNRTTRLFIAAVIAIAVIGIGYLTMKKPDVTYKIDANQAINLVMDTASQISPVTLSEALNNKASDLALIDIRNADEFNKGHLGDAVNMPLRDLLTQPNLKKLKAMTAKHPYLVLYGSDQLQGSSSLLLLQQIGFMNLKVLQGGYSYFVSQSSDSLAKTNSAGFYSEISRIDTALLKVNSASAAQPASVKITPKAKKPEAIDLNKKPGTTGGGC